MTEITNSEDLSAEVRQSLANWLMAMSDTKHLLGLRYAEWCTGAPELEADIAASAMAQFELGHARVLRGVLGDLPEDPRDETRDTDMGAWFSAAALDRPFADWTELVASNALVDALLTVNLQSAKDGGYRPLTQRLRKVLAEEEYHAVHAGAWIQRLAAGPEATVVRLRAVVDAVWGGCLAWFGPETGNGLDELYDAGVLADDAAGLRQRYIDTVAPAFEGTSLRLAPHAETDWDGWSAASRRHGIPAFNERCFAMVTGATTRAMGVRD